MSSPLSWGMRDAYDVCGASMCPWDMEGGVWSLLGSSCPLLAQLALHNPHIWANSLKPVCFLCFLLFWCPLLPFIETGTLKIYTKMVLYMKNKFLTSNTPSMGFEPTLYQP